MSTHSVRESRSSEDWVSQADAARIRGVSRQAIARLIKKGRFDVLRIGAKVLLKRSEVRIIQARAAGETVQVSESLKSLEKLFDQCTAEEQAALLDYLKARLPQHPLEKEWGVGAEVILSAISRSTDPHEAWRAAASSRRRSLSGMSSQTSMVGKESPS